MNFGAFAQKISSRLSSLFSKMSPKREETKHTFEINTPVQPEKYSPHIRATKAYADQRQKAERNRRKKPTKQMRNLYCLS